MKRCLLLWLLFASGCADETLAPQALAGTLTLELRDPVALEIAVGADGRSATAALTPSAGYGLMAPGVTLRGAGRRDRFEEASGTLYSAKLSSPAELGGPCGSEPVSLALSLHRQGENATVMGGLTAYCGAERWHGEPARVLRLAGALPLPAR